MAAKKTKKKAAPNVGDVLAMRFGKGREATCRVVASTPDCPLTARMSGQRKPMPMICVVVLGEGAQTPRVFDRHVANGQEARLIGCWVSAEAPPPPPFRVVGTAHLSRAERALAAHPDDAHRKAKRSITGKIVEMDDWSSLVRLTAAQWDWDHHRDAILAAQAREKSRQEAIDRRANVAMERARRALAKAGVRSLVRTRFFKTWKGQVPARMIAACERTAHRAVESLSRSPANTREQKLRALTTLVRAFNALDGKHRHTFSTPDAETIDEAIFDIATALGIDETTYDRVVDPVRAF